MAYTDLDLAAPTTALTRQVALDKTRTNFQVVMQMLAARAINAAENPYFAKGDGTTDDTAAIQAACAAAQAAGGGYVVLPATPYGYRVPTGVTAGNGVVLVGTGTPGFPGMTATPAQWAASGGTWLRPEHPTTPAVRLVGHGSGVINMGFVHNQPVPGGSFTPTNFGWCIQNEAINTTIRDITIVNASHGIRLLGTTGSGGGTNVVVDRCLISAFWVRLQTEYLNDVPYLRGLSMRNLYYADTASVVSWIRANTIDWNCGYTDNAVVDGLEFFEGRGFRFFDQTCLGITHSAYNLQATNVQGDLGQVFMAVENSSTTVRAQLTSVMLQAGNAFGYTWSDTAMQLGSDNVDIKFTNLVVPDAGGKILTLGAGTGGRVSIDGLTVEKYSSVLAAQPAFEASAGSTLSINGIHRFDRVGSAGARFAGSGTVRLRQSDRAIFPRFQDIGSITGTAAWVDLSTSSLISPADWAIQARLSGQIFVLTPQTGGTLQLRMSGHPEVITASVSAATSGWKTFDTGWVDLTANTTSLGRLQMLASTGVVVNNAELNLQSR